MAKPHDHLADRHPMHYLSDELCDFVESIQPPGPMDIDITSDYMRVWPNYVVGLQLVELSFKALIAKSGVALGNIAKIHDFRALYRNLTSEEHEAYEGALDEFAKHVHPTLPPVSFNDKGNWDILEAHRYFPLEGGKKWTVNKKTKEHKVSPVQGMFRISVWHIREMCFVSHRLLGLFGDAPSMGAFSRRLNWRFNRYFNDVHRLPGGIDGFGVPGYPDDTESDIADRIAKFRSDKIASLGSTTEERLLSVMRDPNAGNVLRTDCALFLNKLGRRSDAVKASVERARKDDEEFNRARKDDEEFNEKLNDPGWKGSLLRQALGREPRPSDSQVWESNA